MSKKPAKQSTATPGKIATRSSLVPRFIRGDAASVMAKWPDECIDCCMTSPPYWGHREYEGGGIGRETRPEDYVDALCATFEALAIDSYVLDAKVPLSAYLEAAETDDEAKRIGEDNARELYRFPRA